MAPPPVPATDPTPCPADPYGRQLRPDCTPDPCVVRIGLVDGYESVAYVLGHVPGGDHGTTRSYVLDCTVQTVPPATSPAPTLPNTGNSSGTIVLTAIACLAVGGLCVGLSRREGTPSDQTGGTS